MKIKFGSLVVAGSGKIGGHVASRNRAGAYLRTKVTPVNPQTTSQSEVRARLTLLAQNWRGLTDAQRAAWNGAVSDFQSTDVFGDIRKPSGNTLYQKLNNNLLTVGASPIDEPPLPSEVGTITVSSITADNTLGTISVALSNAVPADTSVKLFATAPQSPGVNFVKSEYRLIDVLAPAATSPADITAAYEAKFGAFATGSKVFVKLVPVNETTGQEGAASVASTIVIES